MDKIIKNLRALRRIFFGLTAVPLIAGMAAAQGFVAGPIFRNHTVIPNLFFRICRSLLGLKVSFNKESAPVVEDRPVWFVSNHISEMDPLVLGDTLQGSFVGKAEIAKWPFIAQVAKAGRFIAVRRSAKHNEENRGKIVRNFNKGFNTIMFPEATTGKGDKVHMFRAGLVTALFDEKATDKKNREIKLQKDVLVQPVAIRVKEVAGMDALNSDELRSTYTMHGAKSGMKKVWQRLQVKDVTVELTVLQPLDPENYSDAKELINQAARDVASVINPGQTTFEKAPIPGRRKKKPQAAKAAA
jgi:1-acyl-sn-glycerol-3-phosphate acyltransferase